MAADSLNARPDLAARIKAGLDSADPVQALRGLVDAFAGEGASTETIYDQFERVMLAERSAGRSSREELLLELMDALTGWCHPDFALPRPGPRT
jgi:hypothetical protein